MLMIFPADAEDEVLLHAESTAGAILIFCTADCKDHIHFQFSICGHCEEGRAFLDGKSKAQVAIELMNFISVKIQQEVQDERSSETLH